MLAFVFPGQGAQHAGMGKELSENFSVAREVFEEANDSLGLDLAKMCYEGPEEDLKLTANTQPAILTTSVAALRVVQQETGLQPDFVAGHSLGEYSALVAAQAVDFADAVCLVRQRGTFMQQAVPIGSGAMAAILGVDAELLEELCAQAAQNEVVSAANYNSPGQIVIAGNATAVDRAIALAKDNGARKAMMLPVSAPFHCALMLPAGEKLEQVLNTVVMHDIKVPVVTNVEAVANSDSSRIKRLLIDQVSAPVRWESSVRNMLDNGVERFIEIGPGKVLCGLIRRIERKAKISNVENIASLKSALA
ncbi:MAG: [acyl-carrier-protein] S-malonyltransferase [Desulfobacteraceae bacterium 4572_35.1]|nr:MAG: [acyl-carrier-protein] S-malonyltransferase [Desulfobacteraceae bacterium 4572_35.1]